MTRFTLHIKTDNQSLKYKYLEYTESHEGDSGIDLYTPEEVSFLPGETKLVNLEIKCQMLDNMTEKTVSYYLYPRSSISKSPLILANSTGIIDAGYRGNIMAALKYVPTTEHFLEINETGKLDLIKNKFILNAGTRIVQICSGDLTPVNVKLADDLTSTSRGEGGFGSTGI